MPRIPVVAAIALALLAAPAAHAQGKQTVRLDSVSLHMFLATSGTLSEDIAKIDGFMARNFSVEGKGLGDNERFYAVVVRVKLTAPKEIFAEGPQAEVVVTERRTKKVVKRERIADVYIGSHGWTHVPVFLPNAACGPFEIAVTGGGRKLTRVIEATCGE